MSPLCPVCVSQATWINPPYWGGFGPPKASTVICNWCVLCLHHKCPKKGHPSISFTFFPRSLKQWINTCILCKSVVQSLANYMLNWPTMTQTFPYFPRVYNMYSIVNLTSKWKSHPSYHYKTKYHCCISKWWKTHHLFYMKEMCHVTYKTRPKYHSCFISDGKTHHHFYMKKCNTWFTKIRPWKANTSRKII